MVKSTAFIRIFYDFFVLTVYLASGYLFNLERAFLKILFF